MKNRAIVLGTGVEGLVAAHLLARAGREVVLLGAHAHPIVEGAPDATILRALGIEGLEVQLPDPWAVAALPDGGRLELFRDVARTAHSLRRISARDAESWPRFCERMHRLGRFLHSLYLESPRSPLDVGFALRVRRLGRQGMEDLMRVLPMPVAELLDDWFENDALKGLLGAAGVRNLLQGPRSGGTAFRLLHEHAGCAPGVFRLPRSNLAAVLAVRPGVSLRQLEPARIMVRAGAVAGVVGTDGEEIPAGLVVSAEDPRRTLLDLCDPAWLDPELARDVRNIRARGAASRVSLDLEGPAATATLTIAPSLDYLERAYDDAKHGRVSKTPWLEARLEGPRAEVHVQYAPRGAKDAALGERVAGLLARHVPGMAVKHIEVETQGQADPAELTLDQALWARPLAALARYRTPIEGLWLCGPAMHPGGAIAGASAYNCVREILGR